MINTKQGVWLLGILGLITVILLGILFFVPAKKVTSPIVNGIEITSPKVNAEISSPLKITGIVSGNGWAGFEGQVGTVKLLDGRYLDGMGKEMATGVLTATTEWTTLPTSFETTLNFQANGAQSGVLVFYNENPSGDPSKLKTFILPVKIKSGEETMTVKAFFSKDNGAADQDCTAVFSVDRVVAKTQATAAAALAELLKGTTDAEKAQGYLTEIPVGSKLNSLSIVNGEARADFNAATESGGGSCSMAARTVQITKTLMQFPTITLVRLSIDGRTGDIFQP